MSMRGTYYLYSLKPNPQPRSVEDYLRFFRGEFGHQPLEIYSGAESCWYDLLRVIEPESKYWSNMTVYPEGWSPGQAKEFIPEMCSVLAPGFVKATLAMLFDLKRAAFSARHAENECETEEDELYEVFLEYRDLLGRAMQDSSQNTGIYFHVQ